MESGTVLLAAVLAAVLATGGLMVLTNRWARVDRVGGDRGGGLHVAGGLLVVGNSWGGVHLLNGGNLDGLDSDRLDGWGGLEGNGLHGLDGLDCLDGGHGWGSVVDGLLLLVGSVVVLLGLVLLALLALGDNGVERFLE